MTAPPALRQGVAAGLRQGVATPCPDWGAGDEGNKPEVFLVAMHHWPALPAKKLYRKTLKLTRQHACASILDAVLWRTF